MEIDWASAIEFHRDRLLRVVAALAAMARLDDAAPAGMLPRHVVRHIVRLLRPAEAAARRLIVIAAHGLAVTVVPAGDTRKASPRATEPGPAAKRTRNARPRGDGLTVRIPAATGGARPGRLAVQALPHTAPASGSGARIAAFPLIDPRKRFADRPRRKGRRDVPRVRALWSVPVYLRVPEPELPRTPLSSDRIPATRVHGRLLRLRGVLADIDAEARRLARMEARRRLRTGPVALPPMRPGYPPGRNKRAPDPVHDILMDCHSLALARLRPADTS